MVLHLCQLKLRYSITLGKLSKSEEKVAGVMSFQRAFVWAIPDAYSLAMIIANFDMTKTCLWCSLEARNPVHLSKLDQRCIYLVFRFLSNLQAESAKFT